MEEENPLGLNYTPTFGDAVQGAVDYVGGVVRFYQKAVPQFFTGVRRGIKEEAETPVTPATGVESVTKLPQEYARTESRFLEQVASGVEAIGLPEPVAGAAALAVSPFLPGPAEAGLIMKGGTAMMGLTVTDPRFIAKGVAQDVAQTPKFAPAVKTYTERGQAYADAVEQVQSNLASGKISESRLKKTLAKIEKIRKGDVSTFEYDPANPYAYREGIESSFNPYVSTPEYTGLRKDAPRGVVSKRAKEVQVDDPFEIGRKAQQHHVLAKAETKPFADALMDLIEKGIANEDDLVNFFVWPEQYDLFPGNVLNNLLDMGEITHTVAKKDPMALHKILKEAGLEFGSGTEKQIIKNYGLDQVKSADDLMKAYDRYLQEIAIPSKEITYKVHDMWYDKTVKQLKGAELKEFKEKYSKLSDPRKNR